MELDKEYQTMSWLECETVVDSGQKMLYILKCKVLVNYNLTDFETIYNSINLF